MIEIPKRYAEVYEYVKTHEVHGFMGLSLGSQQFLDKQAMREYSQFMSETFHESTFILGDYLKIHNIMALEGVSKNHAFEKVIRQRDAMSGLLKKILPDNVHVRNYSDMMTIGVEISQAATETGYSYDDQFRRDCDMVVRGFLRPLVRNLNQHYREKECAQSGCTKYFLDELGFLNRVPEQLSEGDVCEIYPGRNEVKEKIHQDKYLFCKERQYGFGKQMTHNPSRKFMEVYYNPSLEVRLV